MIHIKYYALKIKYKETNVLKKKTGLCLRRLGKQIRISCFHDVTSFYRKWRHTYLEVLPSVAANDITDAREEDTLLPPRLQVSQEPLGTCANLTKRLQFRKAKTTFKIVFYDCAQKSYYGFTLTSITSEKSILWSRFDITAFSPEMFYKNIVKVC